MSFDWHAYLDRVRAGRCLAASVVVPPPLVPTPLHDLIERVRDGRSALFCGGAPPPGADFDLFSSTPFDGGDLVAPFVPMALGLDWGGNSGDSGQFLTGRAGTATALRVHIEPGDNTLDDVAQWMFRVNGNPSGLFVAIPAGDDGDFAAVGSVAYLATDKIDLYLNSAATSGTLRAPRATAKLEDA